MFRKQHPKVGAKPGTLVIREGAPPPKLRLISYDRANVDDREISVNDLEGLIESLDDTTVAWIDVQGFGDKKLIRKVGSIFKLHALLLEDVVNVPQRPKTEAYEDQLLIIVRMARLDRFGLVETEQLSVVLGKNYVMTFQETYGDIFDPVRKRINDAKTAIRKQGADYLAYAIVDTTVDGYYPVLETIGDRLEQLESEVVAHPSPALLGRLNVLKNRLVNLRRGIWPQREALSALARGDHAAVSDEVRLHFRDTYDHCVQTSEVTEMYREMVTGLMNVYLSSIANRTNEVMKVLTIVATIFIPLTFLAGIYGMNFEHMPELQSRWGYPMIWIAMAVTSIGMLAFFCARAGSAPANDLETQGNFDGPFEPAPEASLPRITVSMSI